MRNELNNSINALRKVRSEMDSRMLELCFILRECDWQGFGLQTKLVNNLGQVDTLGNWADTLLEYHNIEDTIRELNNLEEVDNV